jgi:CYTH domain-containing protein
LPEFQPAVLEHVLHHERVFRRLALHAAARGERPVLVADRGVCDQLAYMDQSSFEQLLLTQSQQFVSVRDERYDGVIYLRSAANGAEAFYGAESNTTRYETIEEARLLDDRTLHAWIGTPHLSVIENIPGESFKGKLSRSVAALARIIGEPEPLEAERKFKVVNFDPSQLPEHTVPCQIVQTYLVGVDGRGERVRARGQNNYWVYSHTIKQSVAAGVAIERERIITRGEYENFLVRRNSRLNVIQKTRYCFVCGGHYCELDLFHTGNMAGQALLEIELARDQMDAPLKLPPFLQIESEETHNKAYSNYAMAA